ncbi:hypothetical protein TTHERM_00733920 (macronuclear) [Tetrahymena thermophila SB210]|uniref:Cell surface immobilization antigen n=1 Tax=Tetrahymena thermophila (strain SB210) TaxID=312017 RepID=Q232A5_TETTS|nr:hypothetical protein TTHERM_00733920 [Tetrahymena thermophila SB210]EAR91295.1 hypothetical protein TTHERM_00733920 [Tetrahymena thermophila SB210]|eukprot:XP_001011540.1 hypothetical protein TTHERM_00733920 [Tetrahymena thermophila SB210]
MTILKLLIVSLLVSQIFAVGADVLCSDTQCTTPGNCPTPPTSTPALSWGNGLGAGRCAIKSCPLSGTSITGTSDIYCQSCPGTPNGSNQAVFANTAGNACVASSATCGNSRPANTWTDADCLICNGNTAQYANAYNSGCQATIPLPGTDVSCTGTGCASPANCPTPPTSSLPLSWVTGSGAGKCAINACPPSGTSITGATDLYCQSCPGTPNGSNQAVFANIAGNTCVASTATCGNSRAANTWTDADCLACNGNTAQYAKADKSGCQANPIPGADVSCTGTGCVSPANCPTPPTSTLTLSWVTGSGAGKCAINTCPKSGTSITGVTDLYCQSCPGTPSGNIQAVFANTAGNACVASTGTCGNSRNINTWTNADCLACNGTTNQYAKSDKSGCQSTAPSSAQSSSNSMIILSSVLFLVTFLF